jgi:hypothetical protein
VVLSFAVQAAPAVVLRLGLAASAAGTFVTHAQQETIAVLHSTSAIPEVPSLGQPSEERSARYTRDSWVVAAAE